MPKNNEVVEDTVETFVEEVAPAPVVGEALAAKPYGQNVGDIVEASQATGGQYEAVGAGRYRRLA